MLLEASESPLLGVGEGSRFGIPASDFLEARGLEEVLCDVGVMAGGLILTAPASSPSDFRLLALETEISVESSLLVLLGLDLELGVWRERKFKYLSQPHRTNISSFTERIFFYCVIYRMALIFHGSKFSRIL